MKKNIFVLCLVLMTVLLVSGSSLAAQVDNTDDPGSILTVGTAEDNVEFTFSPSVAGLYGDDDDDNQWYVISTYHSGGTRTFATAQNITSIYKTITTDAAGEEVRILSFDDVIDTPASMEDWSTGVWER
jgi:hypothetical protein